MTRMLIGLILGFLILGPIGAFIGLLIGGFLYVGRDKVAGKQSVPIDGHSPGCGCRRCYR